MKDTLNIHVLTILVVFLVIADKRSFHLCSLLGCSYHPHPQLNKCLALNCPRLVYEEPGKCWDIFQGFKKEP